MRRFSAGLIAVLLAAAACTTVATGPVSAQQQCEHGGGIWRAGVGTCEHTMGGGGY